MDNILEYKGYHGSVDFSADDRCLYGKIINISALVTFEGDDANSIESAFHDSVDAYLDLCRRNNIKPEKEYSGQFKYRPGPRLHKQLDMLAKRKRMSLNALVIDACNNYVNNNDTPNQHLYLTMNHYAEPRSVPIPRKEFRMGKIINFPISDQDRRVQS